jgi:N-acetylglucosaminyl-diphospho-decaprenol L-rhamnosyltransferase
MLSVVIVSFNAREHLRRCLDSLYRHLGCDFDVTVVDNASGDGSADMVARDFPQARLLRNTANLGFAAAANLGARSASADVVLFLNPDCELRDDALCPPAAYLSAHQEAGALGVRLLDPDGGLQLSVRRFPDLSVALFNRYSLLTRLLPGNSFSRRYLMTDWAHDSIRSVDWVSGACLMTRRDVLERVGYLDEGFFWGFEDVDFCQRLSSVGLQVLYFPDTAVYHEIGASARAAPFRAVIARHRGMWRYYRRYLSRGPLVDAVAFFAVWGRCALQLLLGALRRALRPASRAPAAP